MFERHSEQVPEPYDLRWGGAHLGIRPGRAGETTAPWASVREYHPTIMKARSGRPVRRRVSVLSQAAPAPRGRLVRVHRGFRLRVAPGWSARRVPAPARPNRRAGRPGPLTIPVVPSPGLRHGRYALRLLVRVSH